MARPISFASSESHSRRRAEFSARLAERGIDTAFVSDPVSVAYLSGFHCEPHERLLALVLRGDDATLVVPALEAENAAQAVSGVGIQAWQDGQDPGVELSSLLRHPRSLGVEAEKISLAGSERVRNWAAGAELIDVGAELTRLRRIKGADEIELLERGALITDRIWEALSPSLRPGVSEVDLALELAAQIRRAGAEESFPALVQSGPNSALPHLGPQPRPLGRGEPVLLDFGAAWGGYRADLTRMAVLGEPDRRLLQVHEAVLAAHDHALSVIRPGQTAGGVDRAARSVLEDFGLGPNFIHRLGHGLGLQAHEEPSLEPGSELVLEPGMVITVEPGAYFAGWGGVRIEDSIVVTKDGSRRLTHCPTGLTVLPTA
ncbi:MAG TPA: Xaa-Pro peptidase family protein [Candidatus Nitrosotalea sp.]|nr:Xaa-Pro peptidase family protein [Candidatus Nitrosotalea sp.]